jgi:hypothetical protein
MADCCQAMTQFEPGCVKNWHPDTKSGPPKLTLF